MISSTAAENNQPPPPSYEELTFPPVYQDQSGNIQLRSAEEVNNENDTPPLSPIRTPITGVHTASISDNNVVDNNTNSPTRILIRATHPTLLHFAYHPHLSTLGITPSEWQTFTSALSSTSATIAGARRTKAVAAGVL
ncbi:MAG: hypothetical protein Q9171_002314, partial [Xanthocarpia ochracea]